MRKFLSILFVATFAMMLKAQTEPQAPWLEYVMEIRAVCDPGFSVGTTSHGERFIIPIKGGTFEGPNLKGTVIPGGADHQLIDKNKGRTELEAIYSIRTEDGVNIHVRNCGILYNGLDENGQQTFYFRTSPKFEAPNDSKYDWLNNSIFICVPEPKPEYISLKIWRVL